MWVNEMVAAIRFEVTKIERARLNCSRALINLGDRVLDCRIGNVPLTRSSFANLG